MDQVTNTSDEYWENEYPYVSPDHSIIDVGDNARYLTDLSALETAFVKWFIELGVSDESFKRCIHPAFPFGDKQRNSRTVFARPRVKQAIKNIRRGLPFLSVYNSDYLIGILHEEIEHFRSGAGRHTLPSQPALDLRHGARVNRADGCGPR